MPARWRLGRSVEGNPMPLLVYHRPSLRNRNASAAMVRLCGHPAGRLLHLSWPDFFQPEAGGPTHLTELRPADVPTGPRA